MTTKRIYLSGPMTGLPDLNFPAFHAEAARLRALGYQVANPAEINPTPDESWQSCLRKDLAALLACDALALLPGWEKSLGANLELHVAHRVGIEILIAKELTHMHTNTQVPAAGVANTSTRYSTDEEFFHLESAAEAIQELIASGQVEVGHVYYSCETRPVAHTEYLNVANVLDEADDRAFDMLGDCFDNAYSSVPQTAKDELQDLLVAWARKHTKVEATYWMCYSNTTEHRITAEDLADHGLTMVDGIWPDVTTVQPQLTQEPIHASEHNQRAGQDAQGHAQDAPPHAGGVGAVMRPITFEPVADRSGQTGTEHADGQPDRRCAGVCGAGQVCGKEGAGLSAAARDILAERQRQISAEGWTPEHDDEHVNDEIAAMAALYAMPEAVRDWPAEETGYGHTFGEAILPEGWKAKFGDRRRELVKAGALIVADIERLDREATAATQPKATP